MENAPRVEIVILFVGPKNNEETGSSRSLLQLCVAVSFIQHHALLSSQAKHPASRVVGGTVPIRVTNSLPPLSPHTLASARHCRPVIPITNFINAFSYVLSLFTSYRSWQRLR